MRRLLSVGLLLALAGLARGQSNCPTGQNCGVNSAYCDSYTAPSTSGATLISSLPAVISSAGSYYLNADLSSAGIGIAVLASNVDINLNGHTLTYGTSANGSGSSQIGEYGVIICNTGNLSSEFLDSSYGSNGYCKSGASANSVTVENGTITESTSASSYYDPLNCPGSGINSGCFHNHDTIASHAVDVNNSYGFKITHVTINFSTVDAYGIRFDGQAVGGSYGLDAECNTLNNSVTQYNRRDEANATIWSGNDTISGLSANIAKYNTVVGGAQGGILLGVGLTDPPGTTIANNDVAQAVNQGGTSAEMYSNDYAIAACTKGGFIEYNYVHSAEGRGVGCIYAGDLQNTLITGNYVDTGEDKVNGEYGSNGTVQGGSWVGGCEIQGGRGFEVKDAYAFQLMNNTFRTHVGQCGGSAIEISELPCVASDFNGCSTTASNPIVIQNNTEVVYNNGSQTQAMNGEDMGCINLEQAEGNYSNYFSTPDFQSDNCTSDGDFITSEAYSPADNFTFYSPTFSLGSKPYTTGCSGTGSSFPCGNALNFQGQAGQGIPDELGYVVKDLTLGNGATLTFHGGGSYGTGTTQRGVTVEWTYTPTVKNSGGALVSGATVSATDQLGSYTPSCTTSGSGVCSIAVRQETVTEPANGSGLTTSSANPNAFTISASGYTTLNYSESITATTSEFKVFGGVVIILPPLNLGLMVQ